MLVVLILCLSVFACEPLSLMQTGPLTFSLHARKTTLKLTAKTDEDADQWIGALQDVSATITLAGLEIFLS